MPSFSIPRGQSTFSIAFASLLICLFFPSATLASPVHHACSCTEDQGMILPLKPRKNGRDKDCAWLQRKVPAKQNKVCRKLKRKDGNICPITCGLWDATLTKEPAAAETCDNPGLSCDCDYKVFGCTPEEEQCSPSKYYTCMEAPDGDLSWAVAVVDPRPCDVPIKFESCDPSSFCTVDPPVAMTACDAAQVGLNCPYNYQYMGCNFEDGFSCIARDYYYCSEDEEWQLAVLMPEPCFDPDPRSPAGNTCEPCPTVEPAEICPSEKPKLEEDCSVNSSVECQYDYRARGCSEDELECRPSSRFKCINGQWEAKPIPEEPCPPTNKPCPDEKPDAHSPCRMFGYDLGLKCNYEYRNLSCTEGEELCSATEFYTCFDGGWAVVMPRIMWCEDDKASSTFYDPCTP